VSTGGGTRAIIAALLANAGIAVAKFVGYLITGSSSMLAESVHSVADTSNQGLLLLGGNRAKRAATTEHPFGYGRDRYFYAFVVALVLFTLGSLFSLYEGYHKLRDHEAELDRPQVAIVILLVALVLEGFSLRTAIVESNHVRGESNWVQFIRRAKAPELPVVLLEDTGALIGLVFALAGVGLSWATGDTVWDGIGTIMIGLLLGAIAIILIVETKSLLIGEGAAPQTVDKIVAALVGPGVDRVIHLRTQYLGPEELLVAAKIAIPRTTVMERVAGAIDDAERRVRQAVPEVRLIYLEPDLERPVSRRQVGADPDAPEFEPSP
jgi:cation diffusion facilitator family transporter